MSDVKMDDPEHKTLFKSLTEAQHNYKEALKKKDMEALTKELKTRSDMTPAVRDFALNYAKQRLTEREDSSIYYGRVTRGGPFLYPDGWKVKDYKQMKPEFQKTDHLPIFGSQTYGSHAEDKKTTHLIGFATNWEYDDLNEDIFGYQYFFDDVKKLSNLKNPIELPVSIKFDDVGQGNRQVITGLHHLAVSLNKLEDDRCGLEGGKACTISPVRDNLNKTGKSSDSDDSYTSSTTTDSSTIWNTGGRVEHYQKLNNVEISKEAIDMTEKKITTPGTGKEGPISNEIGTDIENCANGEKTEQECKAEQKRKERKGKWDGEVSGKVSKDLEALDITLEDLTALIEENENLRADLEEKEKTTSDLESKVDNLIKWQEKALADQAEKDAAELETLKTDLIGIGVCEDYVKSRNLEDLRDFSLGLTGIDKKKFYDKPEEDLEEDELIPTSLADMGTKLEDVKEKFAYLRMT